MAKSLGEGIARSPAAGETRPAGPDEAARFFGGVLGGNVPCLHAEPGIPLIKRTGKRAYADPDALVTMLPPLGLRRRFDQSQSHGHPLDGPAPSQFVTHWVTSRMGAAPARPAEFIPDGNRGAHPPHRNLGRTRRQVHSCAMTNPVCHPLGYKRDQALRALGDVVGDVVGGRGSATVQRRPRKRLQLPPPPPPPPPP